MSWRARRGPASALVAVDASDDQPAISHQPNRMSLIQQPTINTTSETEEFKSNPRRFTTRPQRGHRLSIEDEHRIRKTSVLLTNRHLHALVRLQNDKTCLDKVKDKILSNAPVKSLSEPGTDAQHGDRISHESDSPRWRQWLRVNIKSTPFRAILYGIVLLDVIALAMDERTAPETTPYVILDIVCTLLLFLEILIKSIAFGLFEGKCAYFTRSKRIVRSLNVLFLALGLLSYAMGYQWRILRSLKTVRCLTLYAGLRRISRSLARAIPFLANVSTLALFFLFAFSIFGLEAYKGAFSEQCKFEPANDTSWTALPTTHCSLNASCLAQLYCGAVPSKSTHVNFDSGLSSLFLVFLVVAQDGWVSDIMQPVVESTSRFSALFFVAIVASMVFLVVNLFVAVITTSFMNFSSDSHRSIEDGCDSHSSADDDEDLATSRGSMIKMDPLEEATRVSLIMGATLAIEESIQQQQQLRQPSQRDADVGPGDENLDTDQPEATLARLLARTRSFHMLYDLSIDEILERTTATKFGTATAGTVLPTDNNEAIGESPTPNDTPTVEDNPQSEPMRTRRSMVTASIRALSPRHAMVDHAPFSSLTDVLHKCESASDPMWFRGFQRLVLSKRFDDFITGCIVVNTAFLLVEYRNMPAWVRTMLSVAEYLFGAIFFAEMLARIIAMRGIRRYLHSTERFFDMIVVVCTSVNMVLNNLPNVDYSGLNSVASLRTLRISRLMLKWEGTRKLIESVVKSSRGVMDVVAFLFLFQVVSSILAMHLFGGGHMTRDGKTPRWNFDTFPRSFLTLLQVITADQWASITYDAVDADDPHPLLVPFLILTFIIGQYVLLNLFIAVILENFSISEEEAYQLQLEQIIAIPKELDIYEKIEEQGVRAFGEMEQLDNVSNVKLRMFLGLDAGADGGGSREHIASSGAFYSTKSTKPAPNQVVALIQRRCQRVAHSTAFHRVVQLMILVSCVALVVDDPHPEIRVEPPNKGIVLALTICNHVALGVFLIDFLAKVGAYGFGFEYVKVHLFRRDEALGYVKKQAYIENQWNQLDCFLLMLTLADEVISQLSDSMSLTRVFRAGRVLRPLRILNHHHEMKLILSAVMQSLPQVGNVFAICALVYIIFGVVGRSLFSGLFFACNDADMTTMDECVGSFTVVPDGGSDPIDAILVPRVWRNARFSFDNIGAAFLTLLEMTSLKWIDKTFMAMDITGPKKQPQMDHTPFNALFFVLYIYIGSLFVIRLFVGVLVEQFQRNNGTQILTESQKSWVDLEKFVLLLKPLMRIPRPHTMVQNKLYDLCQHRYFGRTIAVAILLNVALLLFNPTKRNAINDVESQGQMELTAQSKSFEAIEFFFLTVFLVEAVLKCLAFRHYFILTSTGAFELIILGGSLAAYFLATGIHGLIQAGRIFRMMRVLRFVRLNRGVYAVFQTFRASLKPIGHIFFLLFMIFFIFAIVGRQLFGGVRLGENMNRFSNFRSFSSSFLLLFQIMAGDDWHLTMTDCMQIKPFCVERVSEITGKIESDCGNPVAAVLFFVTYITLVVFFLLNLFIAVVLENFRSCYLQDDVCPISLQDFETYREVFMKYDLHNSGAFPLWQLGNFLADLPPGLRLDRKQHRTAFLQLRSQAQALLESCQQQRCKRPYFNELLRALCIHQLGIRCLPYEQQRDRVKQIFIYRAKVADMLVDATMKGYIQRWRVRKEREKMILLRRKMVPETALHSIRERVRTNASSRSIVGETATADKIPINSMSTEGQSQEFPVSAQEEVVESTKEQGETSVREDAESALREEVVNAGLVENGVESPTEDQDPVEVVKESTAGEELVGTSTEVQDPPIQPLNDRGGVETAACDSADSDAYQQRHHHHKRHHRKHHKHKKYHQKDANVTPIIDDDEVADQDNVAETSTDSMLVSKGFDQPLYAPRRLPKIVPTG